MGRRGGNLGPFLPRWRGRNGRKTCLTSSAPLEQSGTAGGLLAHILQRCNGRAIKTTDMPFLFFFCFLFALQTFPLHHRGLLAFLHGETDPSPLNDGRKGRRRRLISVNGANTVAAPARTKTATPPKPVAGSFRNYGVGWGGETTATVIRSSTSHRF